MKKGLSIASAALALNIASVPFNVLADEVTTPSAVMTNTVTENSTLTKATVSKFSLNGQDSLSAYNEVFKIDNSKIKSIVNNGGVYSKSYLKYATDEINSTHWETGKPNSDTFTNEVTFTFQDIEELNRIVYVGRIGGKGFAQEFEIYGSETENGDDFALVTEGEYKTSVTDVIEIKFDSTDFKRLKFVYKKANQNWASAGEFSFYKEDSVADKMTQLFTDSSKSKLAEPFHSLDALTKLEAEVKSHPLYEQFKEDIENAKALVIQPEIEATTAVTKSFKHFANATYATQFKMDNANIQSIQNNAGHYSNAVIENAIDGNSSTYWETNKSNTASFSNEVVVTFKDTVTLDRIIYGARPSDRKGFAEEFEIYASQTTKGDTYQLVATGKQSMVTGLVEAKFKPTTFKRVKFVFKKSNQNWATLAELAFYKEDKIQDQIDHLFTDATQNKVAEEFNTLDNITALEEQAQSHPLYESYKEDLALAKKIVQGELETEGRIIVAEQRGNMTSHAQQNLKMSFGSNNQPTGIAARAGETITVYVEADAGGPLPQLVFTQQEGSWNAWAKSVSLTPGKNVITVPTIYSGNVVQGGPIYIVNPYTPEQQAKAPIIRFEGGERFPIFTETTDVADFKAFLTDYTARLKADMAAHPDVADRELIDVSEIVSDRIIFTGTTLDAYTQYITNGKDPLDTVHGYDTWINKIFAFSGLDSSTINNDPKSIRENIRLMQPYGAMYAAGNHTGIQRGTVAFMYNDFSVAYPGWGLTHEIGHRLAISAREYGEVTNNMVSMGMSIDYNSIDTRIPYESMYGYLIEENKATMADLALFARLGAFWQLELEHPGYWAELNTLYRERNVSLTDGDLSKQQYLIEFSSEVLQQDLSGYFARHGFTVLDETKEKLSKYTAPKKLWYLNNSVVDYKGDGFTNNAAVNVNIAHNENKQTNTLSFAMDDANKNNVLGYEIVRNDTIIGFTSTGTFVDTTADMNENYTYEVIAYDKKLNSLQGVAVQAFKPSISIEQQVTLKLNQAFHALDYVKAMDYLGNDISDNLTVDSTVDVTKKGNYQVTYSVKNNDVITKKTMTVNVVSDFEYVSDLSAVSSTVQWGGLQKDKAPEGTKIGLLREGVEVTYDKGIGAHANSTLIYNIEGKGYDTFESYIGIDKVMRSNTSSSAKFEVWVDGEKRYSSDVFHATSASEYVQVPVTGAKEVKLITNDAGMNGNTADHTVWADAKFTKNNSKPTLKVASEATKVGQAVAIEGPYSANDIEDGDLTSQVVVTGSDKVNFNKAGNYEVHYSVTDSDGNTVTATRTIAVVNMEDFNYLSDYNWSATQNSYTAPKKDIAVSGNSLRLTNDAGAQVTYAKGIGAHSNSTIVYDLTDKNAAYFTTFVGIDRQMYNTVGSVIFQVYVDGVKQFDSGLMTSKMAQQFVEINVAGAKELKLIVTDGGNGNGSDHATWGDAKIHYANADRLYTGDLEAAVEAIGTVDAENYTEETVYALENAIDVAKKLLADENTSQKAVDEALATLQSAKANLTAIDLKQVITIKDVQLSAAIKAELGIIGKITLGDMRKLTSLTAEYLGVTSLEGLQYAINLTALNIAGNEVTDFSPLKRLTKLATLNANPQFVEMGELNGSLIDVKNIVVGLDGKKVKPDRIAYSKMAGTETKEVDVTSINENPETFTLDLTDEESGFYWLGVTYQLDENRVVLRYLVRK